MSLSAEEWDALRKAHSAWLDAPGSEPMSAEEIADLEELLALWLKGLKRRASSTAKATE